MNGLAFWRGNRQGRQHMLRLETGMTQFSSYIICGTPRSGSTLLCDLLAATGVAGRPASYFRQQSILKWAQRWGLQPPNSVDDVEFDRSYLSAMLREGAAQTGIFGLRLMWGSVADASKRLNGIHGGPADVAMRFEKAFGPTLYIHLSRQNKVAQSVSLVRAEQSGLWHLAADGTERERTAPPQPVAYHADRIAALLSELKSDDTAWADFFATHRIEPLRLTYETVVANPQLALAGILSALGRDPEVAKAANVRTAKMADATSVEWAHRFRQENELCA